MKCANEHSNRLHSHKNIFKKLHRQCHFPAEFPLLPPLHKLQRLFLLFPLFTFPGVSVHIYCRTPVVPAVLLCDFNNVTDLQLHINLQFLCFPCYMCLCTGTWDVSVVTPLPQKKCKKIPQHSAPCKLPPIPLFPKKPEGFGHQPR